MPKDETIVPVDRRPVFIVADIEDQRFNISARNNEITAEVGRQIDMLCKRRRAARRSAVAFADCEIIGTHIGGLGDRTRRGGQRGDS